MIATLFALLLAQSVATYSIDVPAKPPSYSLVVLWLTPAGVGTTTVVPGFDSWRQCMESGRQVAVLRPSTQAASLEARGARWLCLRSSAPKRKEKKP